MKEITLDDIQTQILSDLLKSEDAVIIHIAYTAVFDRIYTEFKQKTSIQLSKHELWELILQLRSKNPAREVPSGPLPGSNAEPPIAASADVSVSQPRSDPPFPESLFPSDAPPAAAQSTVDPAWEPALKDSANKAREQLLIRVARSEFGNTDSRVCAILEQFPETRDSAIALCIRYWQRFNADVLEKWKVSELNFLYELDKIETIGRVRREIQNTLQLFRGLESTAQYRLLFQKNLAEYLSAHKDVVPEVRFYFDETGNEGDKAYVGVAGVCTMNWRQYEIHAAALTQWRSAQGPEPIHFVETGSQRAPRALALLKELEQRRAGLLFLGYAFRGRGSTREILFSLMNQLVIDSLELLRQQGSLNEPRLLRVVKEADAGFDSIYLEQMTKHLTELVAMRFPNQFFVQPVETAVKGRAVLLECADLIAGGMQRRALY